MPDDAALVLQLLLNSGLLQYPDVKLYKAASLLQPEERPTIPVRIADNDPKKYPILRVAPKTEAITNADPLNSLPPGITVFRGTPAYDSDDIRLLAGVLAHEGVHGKRQDYEEVPAYQQQRATLNRLGLLRDNPDVMRNINQRIAQKKGQK